MKNRGTVSLRDVVSMAMVMELRRMVVIIPILNHTDLGEKEKRKGLGRKEGDGNQLFLYGNRCCNTYCNKPRDEVVTLIRLSRVQFLMGPVSFAGEQLH